MKYFYVSQAIYYHYCSQNQYNTADMPKDMRNDNFKCI